MDESDERTITYLHYMDHTYDELILWCNSHHILYQELNRFEQKQIVKAKENGILTPFA